MLRIRLAAPGGEFLFIIGALIGISFFTLKSIELNSQLGLDYLLKRQLIALLLGSVLALFLARVDFNWGRIFYPWTYGLSLLLLGLVLFQGTSIRGAVRWLSWGSFQFQPTEAVKILLLIFYSFFLPALQRRYRDFFSGIIAFFSLLPLLILILLQPDLSTALLFFFFWFILIFLALSDLKFIFSLVLVGLLSLPLLYSQLSPYQKSRLKSFWQPQNDPLGAGYHALQAQIAVGAGRWAGRSWGQGTQSHLAFLPDQHTDFIFATFAEEQGFRGAAVLFLLYGLLFWRLFQRAAKAQTIPGRLFLQGFTALLVLQFFINIGMNIGLLPVTGMPLPFFSYGGSALIFNLAGMGFVFNSSL